MPTETGPTRLDPVGLFSRIHEPEQTRGNLLAPARSAQLLGIRIDITWGMPTDHILRGHSLLARTPEASAAGIPPGPHTT